MRAVRLVLAALWLLAVQERLTAQPAAKLVGQHIYRDGVLASGQPLRATVQKGVALAGAAAACVNCHRRSGLGGSEGQSNIRPIAGRLLFSSSPVGPAPRGTSAGVAGVRPAYTSIGLARALREGIDPAGRVLDRLMPRYALGDDEVAALHAYLEQLSSTAAPGISDREIHFSTVIAPGVHPDRRRAMLDVLHAFFSDKNGGTRMEARRRETRSERMYLAYRTWVLHIWELTGAPESWRPQLEAYYRERPVFAVIGGLGSGSWKPVHEFCEEAELPCLFPDIDYPVDDGAGWYSLYFSRGIALEADVLARQLSETQSGSSRVVQVFRDDQQGRLPAQRLRDALRRRGIDDALTDYPVSGGPLHAEFWSGLLRDERPAVLVAWLGHADIRGLGATGDPPPGLLSIYLSATLCATDPFPPLPEAWVRRLRMVDLSDRPANRAGNLARMNAWLRARQIPLAHARTQANAFFAATITADAIQHIGEHHSQDYLVERVEQMAGSSPFSSIYPRLSLGPGQRFASRGGYILGFPQGAAGMAEPVSDWLIP